MWQQTVPIDLPASLFSGNVVLKGTLPRHSPVAWLRALSQTIYVLAAFDYAGSSFAREKLQEIPLAHASYSHLPLTLRTYLAQRDAAMLRLWLRLFCGERACFSESIALCGGLRAFGWECEVVYGVTCVYMYATTDMHAWIEYAHEAISDPLELPLGYVEIERFGRI